MMSSSLRSPRASTRWLTNYHPVFNSVVLFMCASLMEVVLFFLIKEAYFYPSSLQVTTCCASCGFRQELNRKVQGFCTSVASCASTHAYPPIILLTIDKYSTIWYLWLSFFGIMHHSQKSLHPNPHLSP